MYQNEDTPGCISTVAQPLWHEMQDDYAIEFVDDSGSVAQHLQPPLFPMLGAIYSGLQKGPAVAQKEGRQSHGLIGGCNHDTSVLGINYAEPLTCIAAMN